ncbi:2,3-diaminopropionate biosynthesis protein SbnA [Streptomyces sp. S465]|uniref:2,3-diaminopropionate biosynthesis protein SbnA n=1 Tax=Streptomyces sp. S465 TaxID=2979468 RepID=UPI0022A80DA0|nr:2,3-diaminopropionate biosynthesis protein SbnA [Streptomyces sp. S465]WAP56738.1 2,3-diaminopropionate biosynthesis protein SbnA [Streptomyces sp. S465]
MPVISAPHEINMEDLYVDLGAVVDVPLYLKCESFNFAGSVKLKAAREMVLAAERDGLLAPGSVLVESSSGNLGIALSMIAASRGYGFLCVTDSRCNPASRRQMQALGAQVLTISRPDKTRGLLGARLDYVQRLCAYDPRYVWLNQYDNRHNWLAHYRTTAPAIAEQFPGLDVVFIGAGTTGTLMGCARWFREHEPSVTVVAVDSVGSVTFGGPPARRLIPGLGAGVRPALLDPGLVDEVVMVEEPETIATCRAMARRGFLFGGSTGTVVSGARRWLAGRPGGGPLVSVAIAPDQGDRYLDSVYDPEWVAEHYEEPAGAQLPAPRTDPSSQLVGAG